MKARVGSGVLRWLEGVTGTSPWRSNRDATSLAKAGRMAFSSMPGSNGRVSPPGRGGLRQAANGGGLISARDSKVSRIGFLSIVLIVYSGITLGLIVWNQSSGRGSEPPSAETAWQDDPRQKLPPPRTGGGGGGFSSRTGEDGGRRPDDQWVMGNSGPGNEEENHNRGAVGAQPPSGLVRKDGASVDSGGGGGGLHRGEDGKGGGLVLPGQPPNEDAVVRVDALAGTFVFYDSLQFRHRSTIQL